MDAGNDEQQDERGTNQATGDGTFQGLNFQYFLQAIFIEAVERALSLAVVRPETAKAAV